MNTIAVQPKTIPLAWLAAWILASAIGIAVGFAVMLPLMWSLGESAMEIMPERLVQAVTGVFFGSGVGLAMGLAQWIVLRIRGENSKRWLVGSMLGGVAGGIVIVTFGSLFSNVGDNEPMKVVAFVLLGAVLGGGQYLAARAVVKNALWIVASALGVAGGAAIALLSVAGAAAIALDALRQGLGLIEGALVYGIITAAALWWLTEK